MALPNEARIQMEKKLCLLLFLVVVQKMQKIIQECHLVSFLHTKDTLPLFNNIRYFSRTSINGTLTYHIAFL